MAVKLSIATGNFLTAGTWGVVDATSYLNAESATESLLTTAYSGTRSTAFTPGAITVSHLAVKLCERIGVTGTMSVSLRNSTLGLDDFVTGTEVTINVADLPSALEADLNGGWMFFKLATPILLLAATAYNIQAKTSSITQVDLFCDGTADNLSRCLVTTTTGAPAAGDDLIVAGEMTGAGTSNAFVVTMDALASAITDYGAASTSLVTPSLAICHLGTLSFGSTAATNYYLRQSGSVIVYSGGLLNIGTVATPIPRDSSAILNFDCGANVDFGLTVRNLGTFVAQGLSRTAAKLIYTCKLNTDEAAAQTVLGVDTDTGWLDGDEIVLASTSRTGSETEMRVLSGAAGASSMTVTAGLTNAHSGTSPTQAEIILLTRNVKIIGASATLQGYVDIKATAQIDVDWTEYKWLGSNTANKRGIDVATTTGLSAFTYCSFRDFVVAGSLFVNVIGAASNNYTIQHGVFYNTPGASFLNAVTTGTDWVVDNCIAMGQTGTSAVFGFLDIGGTITNITAAGNATTNIDIYIDESNATIGTINNLTAHSNGTIQFGGVYITGAINGTITTIISWRNASMGLNLFSLGNVILGGVTLFGNTTTNLNFNRGFSNLYIKNIVASGDTTFSTTNGIAFLTGAGADSIFIEDSTFGVVSGIMTAHTRDVLPVLFAFYNLVFHNTLLASGTEVLTQNLLPPGVVIGSQKHDQVAGSHKTFKREGTLVIDTVIFDATPSLRMTPLSATEKLDSRGYNGGFKAAVVNAGTLTVSVKVRESVAGDGTDYNGSRPRIIVKRNAAAGIAADTVLDTATVTSEGGFETLSGVTAAVTDDAVLEFVVDCDGTTGWVNVDTWDAV